MHWPYDDWGAWHMGWMMIGWVVGLVLIGVLVLFAVRAGRARGRGATLARACG